MTRPLAILSSVILLTLITLPGCNKPLDEAQCDKLVDKMVDLLAKGESPSDRVDKVKVELKSDKRALANVRDTCVGKMTKSQYDCVMSAKNFDDATACDGK
jgi:hypothetical protein